MRHSPARLLRRLRAPAVLVCLLLAVAPLARASGTAPDAGLWGALFLQGDFPSEGSEPSKWRWAWDGQARFLDDNDGFQQSLLRPVVGRRLGGGFTGWLGYAWIRTNFTGAKSSDEHRIFQQLTWSKRFDEISVLSRTRLEERLFERNDDLAVRFRQFVKVGVPLGLGTNLRLVAYDEVFLGMNDTDAGPRSGYDQNRLFAGVAIPIEAPVGTTLEIGYLNQHVRRRGDDPLNHILSLNLFLDF